MQGHRSEIARLHSLFYRDQFRKILRWLIGAVLIMFALIGTIIYLLYSQPVQTYFANTTEGKILPLKPIIVNVETK